MIYMYMFYIPSQPPSHFFSNASIGFNFIVFLFRFLYYSWKARNMNQQEAASTLGLDLKLNILDSSLPRESPASSLCSEETGGGGGEAVLVGCPNCIMYIIMSLESNPRCPRCNSQVLLDFLTGNCSKKSSN
ncbi:unnamed protein product [Brassica oleracea var. botrytis]